MIRVRTGIVCLLISVLSGCSGYREDFTCRTNPDAGVCASVTDVYHSGLNEDVKSQGTRAGHVTSDRFPGVRTKEILGKPVVEAPEVWSLWVKPWEDDQSTLHEASTHYILMESGRFRYGAKISSPGQRRNFGSQRSHRRVVTPFKSELVEVESEPFSSQRQSTSASKERQTPESSLPPNFNEQLRQLQERRQQMGAPGPPAPQP